MSIHQPVRDLLWAINSPSLLDESEPCVHSPRAIDASMINEADLLRFLARRKEFRVGRYFENLVLYYLQSILAVDVVAFQEQIVVSGRTVGEFDFIYRDAEGCLTHLETSVKFYLHLPDAPHKGSHFVGPNSADNFELKTNRLFDRQLELSKLHRPEVERRIAMVKGRIYDHISGQPRASHPLRLAKDHLRGEWMFFSELKKHCRSEYQYQVLRKPHWLAGDSSSNTLDSRELIRFAEACFSESIRPLHLSVLNSNEELQRLFVVGDDWPDA